ncbi:ribonuclease E/G [Halalkalibacillus halophilus]|uniref:ribonuclease E/G n=1 Tax=Halalkalibacillus halophilus TaxID=392827 RepID=UPI0003F6740E|nr:ribonuclease E/G [Halalkalibacillus halophilus]
MKKVYIQTRTNKQWLLELTNGNITDFHMQEKGQVQVGDMYSAVIKQVDHRLKACFIDYGGEDHGYLPFHQLKNQSEAKQGNRVLLQVNRLATKGKKVGFTQLIQFKNDHFVYMPFEPGLHYSTKMDKNEHPDLVQFVNNQTQDSEGLIVRTKAFHVDLTFLQSELSSLKARYQNMVKMHEMNMVRKLDQSTSLFSRYLQRCALSSLESVVCDDLNYMQQLKMEYIDLKDLLIYDRNFYLRKPYSNQLLKEHFTKREVHLSSGASVTVDQTEALFVLDVNMNKYRGNLDKDRTAIDINKQAAIACAEQIKMRQLSGIIMIDFINMKDKTAQKEIVDVLNEHLQVDPISYKILGFNELGIMQLTRKRVHKTSYDFFGVKSNLIETDTYYRDWLEEELLQYQSMRVDTVHLQVEHDQLQKWKEVVKSFHEEHQFTFSLYISVGEDLQEVFQTYKIGDEAWLLKDNKAPHKYIDKLF